MTSDARRRPVVFTIRSKNGNPNRGNPNRGSPHLAKLPRMLLGTAESAEIPKASQPATVG